MQQLAQVLATSDQIVKIAPPEPNDTCDSANCPAHAAIRFAFMNGDVLGCVHHARAWINNSPSLVSNDLYIGHSELGIINDGNIYS